MIPIVVTVDEHYVQHLAVMITSLFENNQGLGFHIFVFSDGISNTSEKKLTNLCDKYHQKLTFETINTTIFQNFKISDHISYATYFRLLVFSQLPSKIEKILYLDTDLIILKSIKELWQIDIEDKIIGAVAQPSSLLEVLNIPHGFLYFNCGVMLINISLWRKQNITEKTLKFISNYPEKIRYWDQDALNAICYDSCFYIDKRWNMQQGDFFSKKDAKVNYQSAVILHFTGTSKPWQYMNKHPYKREYYKYLKKTPWYYYQPEDKTIGNFLRKYKLMPFFL